jgi:hypothetical protein
MQNATADEPRESSLDLAGRLRAVLLLVVSGLAFVMFVLVLLTLATSLQLPGKPGWAEAVLIFLTATATIIALARHLPVQQVLLGAGIIGGIGGLAHGLAAATAIPFGPIQFLDVGPRLFDYLAWPMPVIWVIAVLNSRGVARLILRPWRKTRRYGFWLLGMTATLSVLFDLALEPFASQARKFWMWMPTKLPVTWFDAPITNLVGWILVVLLILAFATPCLINKEKRPRQSTPDYHPLMVWLLCMALFGVGTFCTGAWLAGAFAAGIGLLVAAFALRGARW